MEVGVTVAAYCTLISNLVTVRSHPVLSISPSSSPGD